MTTILLSLFFGILIGFAWRNSPEKIKKANFITLVGLFFLLMVMGAQLSANKEVLSGIGKIGMEALLIATLSIAGSVLLVQLASRFIQKNLVRAPQEDSAGAGAKR
jgi:uncharacterized membrane protein YadS